MEQEACTGVRGLSPYSAAPVLNKKLLGDLQIDDLHEVKYPVISSSLSVLYEDHFYFINSVPRVEQEGCVGERGLAPDLATHVVSNKSLKTLHQMDDDLREEMKLLVISLHLSKVSDCLK